MLGPGVVWHRSVVQAIPLPPCRIVSIKLVAENKFEPLPADVMAVFALVSQIEEPLLLLIVCRTLAMLSIVALYVGNMYVYLAAEIRELCFKFVVLRSS